MNTHIGIVLDRSGSMESMAIEACGCFNQFIDGLKKIKGQKRITLVQFDNQINTVFEDLKRKDVPKLVNGENYQPRSLTSLYDGLGEIITKMDGNKNVIICVITDGYENASKEYNQASIKALVEQHEQAGWDFQFLAAGIDGTPMAHGIGIHNVTNVTHDAAGYTATTGVMLESTASYMSKGGAKGKTSDKALGA